MIINKIKLENFRNIQDAEFEFSDGMNIICGDNAQGKTNLLESIWLFSGGKSFRGSKDNDLIQFEKPFTRICVEYISHERKQNAKIFISKDKKELKINNVPKKSFSELSNSFHAVVFAPVHLSLIKDGPENRRKFIDEALSQVKPGYSSLIQKYNKTLNQRNALLKEIAFHKELIDTLDIWDDQLSRLGGEIIFERNKYLDLLRNEAEIIHTGLSENKEKFQIKYKFSFKNDKKCDKIILIDLLRKNLKDKQQEDLINKFTSCGPHRDDIEITLNGLKARSFGSQGQQRSCVLTLKIAEAKIIKNIIGEEPIILLDDVLSELDKNRQNFLLNEIKDSQVFITSCNTDQGLTFSKFCSGDSSWINFSSR